MPIIRDRWALIRAFGELTLRAEDQTRFPCTECPSHSTCYESNGLVTSRIVPFSFYPFFMLIFPAGSIHALDFLPMISGASWEEVEARLDTTNQAGRGVCLTASGIGDIKRASFFSQNDHRSFLEVLYLKLTFLGHLFQNAFFNPDRDASCHFGLSLDRIWIHLSEQGNLLPSFWNYSLTTIDIGGNAVKPPFLSKFSETEGLHLFGLIWFYTLLVNRDMGISEVYSVLGGLAERTSSSNSGMLYAPQPGELGRIFPPSNIYWNPQGRRIHEKWLNCWDEALRLGWSFFLDEPTVDPGFRKDSFWAALEQLREDTKCRLFPEEFESPQKEEPQDNQTIREILSKISQKWESALKGEQGEIKSGVSPAITEDYPGAPSDATAGPDQDVHETVILTSRDLGKEAPPSPQDRGPSDETVILARSDRHGTGRHMTSPQPHHDSQETVLLSREALKKDKGRTSPPESDDLEETIGVTSTHEPDSDRGGLILDARSGGISEPNSLSSETSEKERERPEEGGHLEETFIIPSADFEKKGREGFTLEEPQEDIHETVILTDDNLNKQMPPTSQRAQENGKKKKVKGENAILDTIIVNPDNDKESK